MTLVENIRERTGALFSDAMLSSAARHYAVEQQPRSIVRLYNVRPADQGLVLPGSGDRG